MFIAVGGQDRLNRELGSTEIFFEGESIWRLSRSLSDPNQAHLKRVTIDNTLLLVGGSTYCRRRNGG